MDLTDALVKVKSVIRGLFTVPDNDVNIEKLLESIREKSKELGIYKILFDERGYDSDFEKLTYISMTPRQYHKKVMLFTLPQFLTSLYCSLYVSKSVFSKKYWFHSHHVYLILLCSILYWGNYDNENEKLRQMFRRIDMFNTMVSIISLYLRAKRYSRGLTKSTIFAIVMFINMFVLSHYFNKRYPYRSIWFHSMAHSIHHLYNIHYFLTIYRIKLWRRAARYG